MFYLETHGKDRGVMFSRVEKKRQCSKCSDAQDATRPLGVGGCEDGRGAAKALGLLT